jgi:hypothetical protein
LVAAGGAAAASAAAISSSYRVKFKRKQFLELVDIAEPKIIYKIKNMYFFAFDGFVMYTYECEVRDFKLKRIKVLETIEFSNQSWSK